MTGRSRSCCFIGSFLLSLLPPIAATDVHQEVESLKLCQADVPTNIVDIYKTEKFEKPGNPKYEKKSSVHVLVLRGDKSAWNEATEGFGNNLEREECAHSTAQSVEFT
jgi:hypothetical protein